VILSGCEDGILPLRNAQDDEERRLFYVALTRASEELYLLSSRKRRLWGRWQELEMSPFLHNILPERMERIHCIEKKTARKKKPLQKGLF
jgi:superfamily I DNA/RNA helicase